MMLFSNVLLRQAQCLLNICNMTEQCFVKSTLLAFCSIYKFESYIDIEIMKFNVGIVFTK